MRRVETAHMASHGGEASLLLGGQDGAAVGQRVGHGDFHQHVFAGLHALDGLGSVHLGWGGQNDGVNIGARQAFGEIGCGVGDAAFLCEVFDAVGGAPDDGGDLNAVDFGQRVQVFHAKSACGPGDAYFHGGSFGSDGAGRADNI